MNGTAANCSHESFYYANIAKCRAKIPPISTPWPRYEGNATYCYSLSGGNCRTCTSRNVSMQCGWCHASDECAMGDARGPLFGGCSDWSIEALPTSMGHCHAAMSPATTLGLGIGLPLAAVVIAAVVIALVVRSKRKRTAKYGAYQGLNG
jgi:hypothetical protein